MSTLDVLVIGASAVAAVAVVCYTAWKVEAARAGRVHPEGPEETKLWLDYRLELDRRDREGTLPPMWRTASVVRREAPDAPDGAEGTSASDGGGAGADSHRAERDASGPRVEG